MSQRCNDCGIETTDDGVWLWQTDRVCEDCYMDRVEAEVQKFHLFRLQVQLAVGTLMVAGALALGWWLVG